ncbi:MAG: Gfo/Idh/MocA family oxidoreductase [Desulfurococcaceae archaeon]
MSLKVGVIGVGNMGVNHARVYSELAKEGLVEFVGVVDVDLERARRVAKKYDTHAYSNYLELLESRVEAVSVAVPTRLHKKVALNLIERGVHVLVEKPIADTVENAVEMVYAAERHGVILAVGHVERFNLAVQKLREFLRRGILGEVLVMNARRVGPFAPRVSDVSVIVDLAVHDIDIMRYITGLEVRRLYARGRRVYRESMADDYGLLILMFDNGADGLIETNRLTPYKMRTLTVVCDRGVAVVDYTDQRLTLYDEERTSEVRINKEEPLKLEIIDFVTSVKYRKTPMVTGYDGIVALDIAEKALESVKTNSIIEVNRLW